MLPDPEVGLPGISWLVEALLVLLVVLAWLLNKSLPGGAVGSGTYRLALEAMEARAVAEAFVTEGKPPVESLLVLGSMLIEAAMFGSCVLSTGVLSLFTTGFDFELVAFNGAVNLGLTMAKLRVWRLAVGADGVSLMVESPCEFGVLGVIVFLHCG